MSLNPLPFQHRIKPALFRARFREAVFNTGILQSAKPLIALVDAYCHEGAVHLFQPGDSVRVRVRAHGWMNATVASLPVFTHGRLFAFLDNVDRTDNRLMLYWIHDVAGDVVPSWANDGLVTSRIPRQTVWVKHGAHKILLNVDEKSPTTTDVSCLRVARKRFPNIMKHWTGPAASIVARCCNCRNAVLHPELAAVGTAEDVPLGRYTVPRLCRSCFKHDWKAFVDCFTKAMKTDKKLSFPRGLQPLPAVSAEEQIAFEAGAERFAHLMPDDDNGRVTYLTVVKQIVRLEGKDRDAAVHSGFLKR